MIIKKVAKPAVLKRGLVWARDRLTHFQRWRCAEETRRALAAIDDSHLDQLSEIGRDVRRAARRNLGMDRPSTSPPPQKENP